MPELQSVEDPNAGAPPANANGATSSADKPEDVSALKNAHERVKAERRQLKEQLDAIKGEFDGLKAQREALGIDDDEQLRAIIEEHKSLADKKMIESGEVDKLIEKREAEAVKRLKATSEKTITELTEERDRLRSSLHSELVVSGIRSAAIKHRVLDTAEEDVHARGERVFKVGPDGKVHPYGNGGEILRGKDGEELSFDEWMGELRGTAKHLFHPNTGGGATTAGGGDATSGVPSNLQRSKMSVEDKVRFISDQRAKGKSQQESHDAFMALPV